MRLIARIWVGAGAAALVGLLAVRDDPVLWSAGLLAITVLAAAAVAAVPLLDRRLDGLVWWLLAGGLALFALGEGVRLRATADESPLAFPSAVDGARLAGLALVVVALGVVVHRRTPGRDWGSMLDAAIVTTGAATLVWSALASSVEEAASWPSAAFVASVAYPVAGLAALALALRLTMAVGLRLPAASLLLAAVTVLLVGNGLYVAGRLDGSYAPGGVVGLLQVAALVLLAGAALDPSMRSLVGHLVEPDAVPSWERVGLVAVGVAASSASLLWGAVTGAIDPVVAVATVAVLALVSVRVATDLGTFDEALAREAVLQAGSAALVAARSREDVSAAATDTALALAGGTLRAYVGVELDPHPDLAIQDAVVVGGQEPLAVDLRGEIRASGSLGRLGTARTFVVPIVVRGRPRGILRVTGRKPLPRDLYRALGTLGAQISLALDGIERGEETLERRSEARFRALVQSSKDLVAVLEPDLTIRYVTPSAHEMLGHEAPALVGRRVDELLHPDESEQVGALLRDPPRQAARIDREFRLRRAEGGWRTVEAVINDLREDPDVTGLVLTAHDVTERRALEVQLTHQAFHDALTDLPNRALLADRIEHALKRARRAGTDVALLFLDVDDFKTINDSLGHTAGDELLVEVARRLRTCLREADTPARLGGDEFAVLLESPQGIQGAMTVAQRILDEVGRPLAIGTTEVQVRASVGIVFGPPDRSVGEMLRSADMAMYQAKRDGGARYEVFEPHMHELARKRLELKADLESAFRSEQLDLHYQPLIDLATGRPVGFEALLRWTHPVRGKIPPAEFVPLAEETGLINEVGEWVLRRACHQTRAWQVAIPGCARLSANVNLAARQILQPTFVGMVESALSTSGLAAQDLVLEITEGTLLVDVEGVAERLAELRARGIRIAIDDFGTGFSSLAYLQRFPLDELKVAREFVDGVVTDARRHRLVEAIVTLARSLDLEVIAEGIEERAQREKLEALGCRIGQGYLFSTPLPAAEIPALLERVLLDAA